ncbi:MAG: hypothetical protein WD749_04765 [Phycisphaerales bacterium]
MTIEGDNPRPAGFRVVSFAAKQPAWLLRLAVGAGLLVFALVLVVLVVPAAIIAGVVFLAAAVTLDLFSRFRALFRNPFREGGRRNVRVLPPRE